MHKFVAFTKSMRHVDGWLLYSTHVLASCIPCSKMSSYNILSIILFVGNKKVQDYLFEINLTDFFIFSNTKVMK